ncbi:hypothetical protein CTI12_AA557770 [Artemisia annua]|uniref:Zinc finger BED domain-containing protein RICESLEEPER 2 n=1 Tax=Artemisia annua TaxID=35608 RepID=A0A2U1KW54_ARTAN|nr:hypothetical protein CTI12_AA557770 [Artemisia annua]
MNLVKELESPDDYMRKIADQMWLKFNKYWSDFNLLLAVAVVFDPPSKNAISSTSGGSEMNYQVKEGDDGTSQYSKGSAEQQRELDFYLHEPRAATTSSICVLEFWKSQQYKYPVLAKLAMDILCVPFSTVASESAFSLGGRILDQYQSSMKPSTVEALICTRDWLFSEKAMSDADLEKLTENIMKLDIDKNEE